MELNRTLTKYSSYPEEQQAYEAMQKTSFAVADLLIEQPPGTYAIIQGDCIWVSPVNGQLEIVASPDSEFSKPDDVNIFLISDFEGLAASDLDEFRFLMDEWLKQPEFHHGDHEIMDRAVQHWYQLKDPSKS